MAKTELISRPDVKGRWPVRCIGEYCAFLRQQRQRGGSGTSNMAKVVEEGQRIRNALNEAKLRVIEYEEKLRDGQLITLAHRDADHAIIREHILSWAGLLPDELEGRDKYQMRLIINDRARQVLTELSEPGHPSVMETFNRFYAELVAAEEAQQQAGPQEPAGEAKGAGDGR